MLEYEVTGVVFLLSEHHPEGAKGAASQLSAGPHGGLHNHALHGQAEDHGGGEEASRGGLPATEERETEAARGQGVQSRKTQEPQVMFQSSRKRTQIVR